MEKQNYSKKPHDNEPKVETTNPNVTSPKESSKTGRQSTSKKDCPPPVESEVIKLTHSNSTQVKPTKSHSGKHTFRIDPSLISGVQAAPDVTRNTDKKENISMDSGVDEKNKSASIAKKLIAEQVKPLIQSPEKIKVAETSSRSPKPIEDTHVIIRQNSINSSMRNMQKAMRSFDSSVLPTNEPQNIPPRLDKFGEKVFADTVSDTEIRLKDDTEKLRLQAHLHKKLNYSASFAGQSKFNPPANEPENKIKETQPDVRMSRSEGPTNEEDNSVSNVIKRFNDKCETLSRNKPAKTEYVTPADQLSKQHFSSKPMYATMDCRSKRNNLMTRGHTVTEYSVKSEYFKRQTSIGAPYSLESDHKSYTKGSTNHSGSHCVRCVKSDTKTLGHPKVRSKSQSSADDEGLKRSGYDYNAFEDRYRGNVASQRVRFNEQVYNQPKSPFPGNTRGRNRPTSAGNSDCERDDDLFEKYETLV